MSTATVETVTSPAKSKSIPGLDGLRAISIFLVIMTHSRDTTGFPSFVPAMAVDYGGLGVQVFFVLSGFLITGLLAREKRNTGDISIPAFYVRRVLRIFPAFVVFVLSMVLLRAIGVVSLSNTTLLATVTFTLNYFRHPSWCFAHLWSLSVEEQFYFLWPAIMAFCSHTFVVRLAAAVLVTTPIIMSVCFFLHFPFATVLAVRWFPFVADALAGGALLAFGLPKIRANAKAMRLLESKASWLLIPLLFFVYSLRIHPRLFYPLGEWFVVLTVVFFVAKVSTVPLGILQFKPVAMLGRASYSLYLWQQIFLTPHSLSWYARFPQNVVFAVMAAILSRILIELPMLNFKERIQKGMKARAFRTSASEPVRS